MSTSNPSLSSGEELLKLALDKFHEMKAEMEEVVRERDCLKKMEEELRLKLIESDQTAQFYKTRVSVLIQQRVSNSKENSKPNLPDSDGTTPPIPSSSNKRTGKRKADGEYSGTEEEEAGGHTYNNSGVSKTEHDNYNQVCRSRYTRVKGATCQINPIINKIKENLTEENLKKIEESCFGHLLKNNELKFQGQLLLQLLLHMDMGASSKKKLVFNINNSSFNFGPRQFSLITGLRLGTLEATAKTISSSSTPNKILKGINPRILLQNIDKDFLHVNRVGKGNDELALKLSLLHFLYGILFAGNYYRQIDQKYLNLIEDLHKFNAFPWGRVAYQFLASSMLKARKNFDGSKPCLYIYGLSLALQVWAYEVMPSLAKYCAVCVYNPKGRIPRIMRWSTLKKKVCFKDLEKFFTPGDEEHLVLHGIRASSWELEALTTGTIPPQPKKGKFPAATPTSQTHHPARATTQTKAHHVVQAETQTHPLVERCSSSAAGDVAIISHKDDDDDDDDDDEEAAAASNSSQSQDSDDDISDGYMNELVDGITRKMS